MSLIDKLPDRSQQCYEVVANATFVEFQASPHLRATFPIAQLARAVWQDCSAQQPAPEGAPEHWRLCFATADVAITGWRLDKLATYLREHKLAVLRTVPGRKDFTPHEPIIASIKIFQNDEPEQEPPPSEDNGGNNAPSPLPPDREPSGSVLHRHAR